MTEPTHYACNLTAEEIPARTAQLQQLVGGLASRERHGREVRLRFDAALAPVVRDFVRDETRCCDFYDFAISQDQTAVELTVRAPAGAEALLASLLDAFDPDGGELDP